MLTDTFTAQAFFTDFQSDIPRALRWTTLRQDSGDPLAFVKLAKQEWEKVEQAAGLSEEDRAKRVKKVIFSDGLDVERAVGLQKGCDELGLGGELSRTRNTYMGPVTRVPMIVEKAAADRKAAFGIGTFLTNDFRKASKPEEVSKPLNIVIKLNEINGRPCVKLSDDKGKVSCLFGGRDRLGLQSWLHFRRGD